eukprot:UN14239
MYVTSKDRNFERRCVFDQSINHQKERDELKPQAKPLPLQIPTSTCPNFKHDRILRFNDVRQFEFYFNQTKLRN